jgi:hypothetical protein
MNHDHPFSSPHWWGWENLGGHPLRKHLARRGLTLAPEPGPPSAALVESREEVAAREARKREQAREAAEEARALRERFALDQRRRDAEARWTSLSAEKRAAILGDIASFGVEPVVAMWRRMLDDETFDVPDDVKESHR